MIRRRDLLAAAPLPGTVLEAQTVLGTRRPNLIVVLLDDLGCTDLGCYGARDLRTPNIDKLAANGVRFTNWYSNAPVCAPARASLLTGRYPGHAGVPNNGPALPAQVPTIASALRANNYKTALVGKWHLGDAPKATPLERGFSEYYGFHSGCVDFYSHRFYWGEPQRPNFHDLYRNGKEIFEDGQYLTERITEEGIAFLKRATPDPFFLYLAYNAPHYPMHAPQKYKDRFRNLDPERQTYAAMIAAVDDGVGQLMDSLKRLGQDQNTVVVLLGDNGATTEPRAGLNGKPAVAGSNGPYRGNKFSLFDGGMHVPCIWHAPQLFPAHTVTREVAMTMDVLPTFLDLARLEAPEGADLDGQSLKGTLGGGKSPHDAIFWQQGPQQAIRQGDWKLVRNGVPYDIDPATGKVRNQPLSGDDALFLSNLAADPGEQKNLRRQHPEILDRLLTELDHWMEQQKERKP